MRMLLLKQQNWIWMLPAALLCLLPGNAAAQTAPMTEAETECVVSVTRDTIQHDAGFRQHVEAVLRQFRAQFCAVNKEAAASQAGSMLVPMIEQPMYPIIKQKCFAANPQRVQEISDRLHGIMVSEVNPVLPRPVCP